MEADRYLLFSIKGTRQEGIPASFDMFIEYLKYVMHSNKIQAYNKEYRNYYCLPDIEPSAKGMNEPDLLQNSDLVM